MNPLLKQVVELYAHCVCRNLIAEQIQTAIETKLSKIAVKKGLPSGEMERLISTSIELCKAVATPKKKVPQPLTEKEFVEAYRALQFFERMNELSADIEAQKEKIDTLLTVPDDWEGTKKEYLASVEEAVKHERFVRDQKSQLRTQYKNEETTEYIEEKFKKEAIAVWKKTGGFLPQAAIEKRLEKLKSVIFHEDSTEEQFYPTPLKIIEKYMIPQAKIEDGMSILEPSAGKGDIADKLRELYPRSPIDTIELNPIRNEYLRLRGYDVVGTDFMTAVPERKYDRIIMNPPFMRTMGIHHVTRAYKEFLKPGGVLVALITAGSYTNKTELDSVKFRKNLVDKYGTTIGIDVKEYNEGIERPITVHIAVVVLQKPLIDEKDIKRDVAELPEVGQLVEEKRNSKRYRVIEVDKGEGNMLLKTASGVEKWVDASEFYADDWDIIEGEEQYVLPERTNNYDTGFQDVNFVVAREELTKTVVGEYVNKFVPYDALGNTKIKPHVIFGANYGVESLRKFKGFLNADGTGTGKTVQQLLIALESIDTHNKPVLILTETDSIIEQSFFGDAKNLLGLDVPDSVESKGEREIKRSPKYKGLYDNLGKMSKVIVRRFNPKIGLQSGINIGTYHDISQLNWDNEPLLNALNGAKADRQKAITQYAQERRSINEQFGKKPSKEQQAIKKDMIDTLNNKRGRDERFSNVLVVEDAWTARQKELLKVWTANISLLILDECHNVKNTGGNTLRAERAQFIIEACPLVAFFSATPSDKAGDIFYLKRAGIYRDESDFSMLMNYIGYFKEKEVLDLEGRLIRRAEWKSDAKIPRKRTLQGMSRIFERLTEDGGMLKRELELKNLTSIMFDVPVPSSAHTLLERIEEAITEDYCEGKDSCMPPKSLIQMEQKRALEPYKLDDAIRLTKQEIAKGRNVAIFCDLVDDGDEEKLWGDKKEGVVRILKERLGAIYGDDAVGVLIGTKSKYEKQERKRNIDKFQDGKKRIIIATVGSGGTGISLDDTVGNAPRTMIIITSPLSAIKAVQVLGRVVRVKSKSRATAYFLFADVDVDEWLKNLLAGKLAMLGSIVAGNVAQLSPKDVEAIDAGGDDSVAAFIEANGTKEKKKKVVHSLFNRDHKQWIDGRTMPQKQPYMIRKYRDTMYYWKKQEQILIKSTSRAEIRKFQLMYESEISKFGFVEESSRYEGTYLKAIYSDDAWNFVINIIKPELQEHIVIPRQVFNVGDKIQIMEDSSRFDIKKDSVGIITKVRPRSNYYLYDVMFAGVLATSIEQEILSFPTSTTDTMTNEIEEHDEIEEYDGDEGQNYEEAFEDEEIEENALAGLGKVARNQLDEILSLLKLGVERNKISDSVRDAVLSKLEKVAKKNGFAYSFTPSPDGSFSVSVGSGLYHFNTKSLPLVQHSEEIATVVQMPISNIRTDEARFQPREKLIEENLQRIIDNYNPIKFKPVTLWKDEQGRVTLIAGHHRLEAKKRMGHTTIPAVFFEGTGQEAEDFGVKDNAGRQRQLAQEDAKYLRTLRERGKNEVEIKTECKKTYGMECTSAYFLSFLDVEGIALQDLNSFSSAPDGEDAKSVSTIAIWVGKIKQNYPQLNRQQENEVYKFAKDNYRKFGRKFNSYNEFSAFALGVLDRKFFGITDDETPINFANLKVTSQSEQDIDRIIEEKRKDMEQARKEMHRQVMKLEARKQNGEEIPQETIDKVIGKYQDRVMQTEILYSREVLRRDERVKDLRSTEVSMFGLDGLGRKVEYTECPPRDENGDFCITPSCIAMLDECIAAQPDTKTLWLDEFGDYKTERWELHNHIIKEVLKDAHCIRRDKPIAILTGGASGSGKSTFLKKFRTYLTSDNLVKIDIDSFREFLPEYKGWNANATQSEVRDIYNRILDNLHASDCKYDVVIDGTMNKSKNYLPLIDRLKSYGYQVFVIYIKVTKATSEQRVLERYKRSGRYVPQFVIDEIFDNGEAPMREIIKKTDGYIIVDNEDNGKIVEKGGKLLPKDRKYSMLQDDLHSLSNINDNPMTTNNEYTDLKKQISLMKHSLNYKQESIELYKNIEQYIYSTFPTPNVSNPSIVLVRDNPDRLPAEFQKEFTINGHNVVLDIATTGHSKRYKYYKIKRIVDDGGLDEYLTDKIHDTKIEIQELTLSLQSLEASFERAANPFVDKFKGEIALLEEAKQSAISVGHKERIEQGIKYLLEGTQESYGYYSVGKLWYLGAKQYASRIIVGLGGERYHKSGKTVSGSVYYELPNAVKVRISDHELPNSDARQEKRDMGIGGDWLEIVLDNPMPFSKLKTFVLDEIASSMDEDDLTEAEEIELFDKITQLRNKTSLSGLDSTFGEEMNKQEEQQPELPQITNEVVEEEHQPELSPIDLGFYDADSIMKIKADYIKLNRTTSLLQKISRPFRMLMWGIQGGGKSTLSLIFSEDMSYNGKTLHVLTEEKIRSGRIGERCGRLNINARRIIFNDQMDFARLREFLTKNPQIEFVTIDSINQLVGATEDLLMSLWTEFPKVSFVFVGQSTKDGKNHSAFPTLAFNVDTVVKVEDLQAVATKHRDGQTGVVFNIGDKRAQQRMQKPIVFNGFTL